MATAKSKVDGTRKKTGGRAKGVKNKATKEVIDRLKELNCDPIEGMAKIAQEAYTDGDFQLAGNMYKELAQYVAPKRKAVEISAANGEDLKVQTQVNFVGITTN